VTEVPAKFRVFILEYMAHLSLKDWRAVGQDFVNLQFVAPGSMHPNDVPGLMDAVWAVLDILMQGGGAKNLDALQNKELVDQVGLDTTNLDEAGFMDGFATVRCLTRRALSPAGSALLTLRSRSVVLTG
jgi:hypothetical protein